MRQPDYSTGQSEQWAAVDAYFTQCLVRPDWALDAALVTNAAAGLPTHDVSAPQGKMLHLFARMCSARRVLEIGTLGGYSTIWIARALAQGGVVTTIEANEDHAEIAKLNIERAGVADRVELLTGIALDVLPSLEGPYDLIFIDADKPNNPNYLRWALALSRREP